MGSIRIRFTERIRARERGIKANPALILIRIRLSLMRQWVQDFKFKSSLIK